MEMEVCVEDPDELCEDDAQHCIICLDSLITTASVKLDSEVTPVMGPASLGADEKNISANSPPEGKDTSASPSDAVDGGSSQSYSHSVKMALSAILEPLERPIPAGDGLCRPCYLLVVQVDQLRTQANTLEACLLERLDRGEGRVPEPASAAAAKRRPGRAPRAARSRPPPPETEMESQNYIAAASPPPSSDHRPASASASASAALISIEIRQEDGKQSGVRSEPAAEIVFSDAAELEELETAADDSPAGSPAAAPAAAPARPKPPPPVDPPPTYIRQEMNSQCGICDLKFDTRVACRDHMRVHQAKKVYFCPLCPSALMARNALETHEIEQHADSKLRPYGCGQCGETFPTPRFLRRHKEAEHSRQLPCQHCRRTFKRQEDLDNHQMVHNDLRPYTCNKCGKSFTKQPVWRQHLRTHGRRPRPFQCAECPRAFLSELHLAVHSRRHRQQMVQCDQCQRQFTSEARLKKHALSCANKHGCDVCGKSFSKKSLLADHTRIHTGEKPFICEYCGAGFAQRSNLTAHKNAVHLNEKPFQCAICTKTFKRKLLLTYHHRAIHSGERPARCSLCSATFVSTQQLRTHQKTHRTAGRPHRCGACGRAFASEERCHAHMFSAHSDKRPFECRECGSGFLRRSQLLTHMEQQGHGSGPGDYIINQPVLQTAAVQPQPQPQPQQQPQPQPLRVKAPASGQFVVQTVAPTAAPSMSRWS